MFENLIKDIVKTSKVNSYPSIEELRKYFKPGKIVDSYGGMQDKVLEFKELGNGKWAVKVIAVDKNGEEKGEKARWHSTLPEQKELNKNSAKKVLFTDGPTFKKLILKKFPEIKSKDIKVNIPSFYNDGVKSLEITVGDKTIFVECGFTAKQKEGFWIGQGQKAKLYQTIDDFFIALSKKLKGN